ncbi:uncharacterized protein I303_103498 [Kwoniella dejecticola CBS 10117]|uniref:WD40 repeat-containing protein SMU1 n=1 Tax=Kwoniella dejecticola CBS 10117 TaxID=1296121 RepID=A0A1A6A6Y6_9TREE|nr:WD-repeat protein [Kwoniella dejecticola CBS 10117]OBR85808.1 WD-repeat protein [Kwoniella dejecticola CBS 10117]
MSSIPTNQAGPSTLNVNVGETLHPHSKSDTALTARQREKAPLRDADLDEITFDDSALDSEIDLLIGQYLESRGISSVSEIWNERILGINRSEERKEWIEDVERCILDGDYSSIENLISKPGLLKSQTQRSFLYLCWRQQFLEHVENRESQKAFNLLSKRLKPLEHYQPVPYDFYSLSYLTSASTVHDAPTFRDWAGVGPERERLVGVWRELMGSERAEALEKRYVPPDRLKTLLRQAAAWQISQVGHTGDGSLKIPSLLTDYRPLQLPERLYHLITGHTANVKCVDLIGPKGALGMSGASDSTLRVFSTEDYSTRHILHGHSSRIWSAASSSSGSTIASGSGDGTIRLWNVYTGECASVLYGDGGDVYDLKWRPGKKNQIVSASYDRILRSWDVETSKQLRTFSGHSQSTLAVAFDYTGNMIASGSKDKHIRLWDAVGGTCIKNITGCLGEITSVEFDQEGRYLLAGCKDNSNRLWDLRMQKNIYRYTGHQNTSKNLIRCSFAHDASLVIGGSEDGCIYLWETEGASTTSSMTIPDVKSLLPSNEVANATPNKPNGDTYSSSTSSWTPAYYPPRDKAGATSVGTNSFDKPTSETIRPLKVSEGHADGAVFDVVWKNGTMLSAGEDGLVGVWSK